MATELHASDLTTGAIPSPKIIQRVSQVVALCLLRQRRVDARPLESPQSRSVHRLPCYRIPRSLLSNCGERTVVAPSGQIDGVGVRVVGADKCRPHVDHALHERQVFVIAVRHRRRQGPEDVVDLSRVTPTQ